MLQNTLLTLFFLTSLFASSAQQRSVEVLDGNKISNLPYGYYLPQFQKSTIKLFDKLNFSSYGDKQIYIGFGVFDREDNNCKYIDAGNNKENFELDFEKIIALEDKTFAISRNRMSFNACKTRVNSYSGYVATPSSASINSSLLNTHYKSRDTWIGYVRTDCFSDYINQKGITQQFDMIAFDKDKCNDQKLHLYSPEDTSLWYEASESELHYCMIEIASPDFERPLKVCAPWWRVESQFAFADDNESLMYDGKYIDVTALGIEAFPIELSVCSVYADYLTTLSNEYTREVECSEYFDRTASSVCPNELLQEVCKVDECEGYIKNSCILQSSNEPIKDYELGYVLVNGAEKKVKMKDKIVIKTYHCPYSPPSLSECLEKSVASIYPVECPGSDCAGLKECLIDDLDNCFSTYTCERIYGSTDNPVVVSGELVGLQGVCSDGTVITSHVDILERENSECLEREEYNETNQTTVPCESEDQKSTYEVIGSITKPDIYESDESCIRTNNLAEARPAETIEIAYKNKTFFKSVFVKSYIDGNQTYLARIGEFNNRIESDMNASNVYIDTEANLTESSQNSNKDPDWINDRITVFQDIDVLKGIFKLLPSIPRELVPGEVTPSCPDGGHYDINSKACVVDPTGEKVVLKEIDTGLKKSNDGWFYKETFNINFDSSKDYFLEIEMLDEQAYVFINDKMVFWNFASSSLIIAQDYNYTAFLNYCVKGSYLECSVSFPKIEWDDQGQVGTAYGGDTSYWVLKLNSLLSDGSNTFNMGAVNGNGRGGIRAKVYTYNISCPASYDYNSTSNKCEQHAGDINLTCPDYYMLDDRSVCVLTQPEHLYVFNDTNCSKYTSSSLYTVDDFFYEAYDFSELSASRDDLKNQNGYCVLGSDINYTDDRFDYYVSTFEGNSSVTYLKSDDQFSGYECQDYADNLFAYNYENTERCSIWIEQVEEITYTPTDVNMPTYTETEGSFIVSTNGYSDIFTI